MAASEQKLKQLSQQLGETVERINELQTKKPFFVRMRNHVTAHGGNITNMLLAGCLLSVALGRLNLKQQYEAEKETLREEIHTLQSENASLHSEVGKLKSQKQAIRNLVQRELDHGGWRLGPVASRLRTGILGDHGPDSSTSLGGINSQPAQEIPVELQRGDQIAAEVKQPKLMI